MKNKSKFKNVALCAVFSALTVVLLLMGTLLDIFDLTVAAACSLITLTALKETNVKSTTIMFFSSAVLAFIFTPASSATIYYISFFGYFPLLMPHFTKLKKAVNLILSFMIFNIAMIADYLLFTKLFGIENELWWMYALLIAVGNVFFLAYRYALAVFSFIYDKKLKRIFRI